MTDYTDLVERLSGSQNIRQIAAAKAIEAQAKRIEELEAALKPFADKAFVLTDLPDNWMANVKVSYFRAAHKVLGDKE